MRKLLLKSMVSLAGVAFLYGLLYFFADNPVALWARQVSHASPAYKIGSFLSRYPSSDILALLIAVLLVFTVVHDALWGRAGWSQAVLYILVTVVVCMAVTKGMKFLLGRCRPELLYAKGEYGFRFLSSGWVFNSSPSGHTARAFALAAGASLLWKRFAVFFYGGAVLIGLSRIIVQAHYPGDVLLGAYIGILSAVWVRRYWNTRD